MAPSTPKRKHAGSQGSPSREQPTLFAFLSSPSADDACQLESDAAYARTLASDTAQIEADAAFAQSLQAAWRNDAAPVAEPASTPMPSKVFSPRKRAKIDTAVLDKQLASMDFGMDPSQFDPAIDTTHWPCTHDGIAVPYALLAHGFSIAAKERGRTRILHVMTNMLRIVRHYEPSSLLAAVYLMSNHIAPSFHGIELGLGGAAIQRITLQVSGKKQAYLRKLWAQTGDAGDVAFEAFRDVVQLVEHAPLTLTKVYSTLHAISKASGPRSGATKQSLAARLLSAARGEERRFIVRTLCANLRIHAMRTTVLSALVRAHVLDDGTSQAQLAQASDAPIQSIAAMLQQADALGKRAYARRPDMGSIVDMLRDGIAGLQCAEIVPGTPVTPMLGSITRSFDAVLETMGNAAFVSEYKYDGQRIQLHVGNGVHVFSRHLETITDKYPDLCALAPFLSQHATSFIVDAEAVAVAPDSSLLPFQTLAARARKQVALQDIQVRVCLYVFDLLYLHGRSLLELTLRERRALLRAHFPQHIPTTAQHAGFQYAASCEHTSEMSVRTFFQSACEQRCEGIMIKRLDRPAEANGRMTQLSTYEPDKRSEAWFKVKKDYLQGIGDSLDLVPIGAWQGMGRKAAFWSPILLALYDPDTGMFQAVCKCISGFSDAFYKVLNEQYETAYLPAALDQYETNGLMADVWWPPTQVWEIRGADITISPTYPAAAGIVSERGLSLRFPRFIRERSDKRVEDATTPQQFAAMYLAQANIK
ncbi:hypothetical protein MVES1_001893 [Malassezia vespertilionis]|uniref:DNA ligase n=1 Tax=Malassezia vespertilionis TaxID=2020962 RepID=A0A2N1JDH6_9BASI|nr:uncharacterized protein MVES1_001893 [Malassezia vespertilionis]PKI84610.1 hypothetical protein MVES_001795 [Malassezia vespertilionis]WFD06542.1 hypothetical protein MVES1_001893 [Malassezia vespertilionis]